MVIVMRKGRRPLVAEISACCLPNLFLSSSLILLHGAYPIAMTGLSLEARPGHPGRTDRFPTILDHKG
jgi:hypothetical protein